MTKKQNSGFTLIETIIYIGLFAVIMTMGLPAVFQLLEGSGQTNGKATVQDEENFVLRKIDWALGSIDPSKSYTPSLGTSAMLSLTRYDGTKVAVRQSGTEVQISEDGGVTYLPLTSSNVSVSALSFTYIAPSGSGPAGISATMTMNGFDASTTKYIRK